MIHVIDTVLLPANKNIVQTAQAAPASASWWKRWWPPTVDALSAPGPLTVFAPTNAAFADLLAELGLTKEQLFANRALLTQVLTYHVVQRPGAEGRRAGGPGHHRARPDVHR